MVEKSRLPSGSRRMTLPPSRGNRSKVCLGKLNRISWHDRLTSSTGPLDLRDEFQLRQYLGVRQEVGWIGLQFGRPRHDVAPSIPATSNPADLRGRTRAVPCTELVEPDHVLVEFGDARFGFDYGSRDRPCRRGDWSPASRARQVWRGHRPRCRRQSRARADSSPSAMYCWYSTTAPAPLSISWPRSNSVSRSMRLQSVGLGADLKAVEGHHIQVDERPGLDQFGQLSFGDSMRFRHPLATPNARCGCSGRRACSGTGCDVHR